MRRTLKRYSFFFFLLIINGFVALFLPEIGEISSNISQDIFFEMLAFIPPIFLLLGLLDVWVERELVMRYMGDKSGIKGALLAFFLGSAAAGPLYAAFPVVAILLKKGVGLLNVFIFIGAWSSTKIPMLLFEASSLGVRYTIIRFLFNCVGIFLIAIIMEKSLTEAEKKDIYDNQQL